MTRPRRQILLMGLLATGWLVTAASGQTLPANPRIHLDARSLVNGGGPDPRWVSTCHSAACRFNELESSTAADSYCDIAPPDPAVPGARGLCATGCPRFMPDLGPDAGRQQTGLLVWDIGTDDAEKPCLVLDCLQGQPCLEGVLPQTTVAGELWDTGASLELQIPDILQFPGDFSLIVVLRRDPSQAQSQCLLGDATHHLCVEADGAVRLRLGLDHRLLTAPEALTRPGLAQRFDWHLLEVYRQGNTLGVEIDGLEARLGNPTSTQPFVVSNFLSYFKGHGAFGGRLAFVALYDRALSAGEKRQLRRYLGTLFGVGPAANRHQPLAATPG